MNAMPANFEVIVAGGGPVGLTASLLCARLGLSTAAVIPVLSHMQPDRRTAALFTGSIALLRNLNLWEALAVHAAPIQGIRIVDDRGHLLRAPEAVFRADEQDLTEFGFNVANAALSDALMAAVRDEPNLTLIPAAVATLTEGADGVDLVTDCGRRIVAQVVVGADGRKSTVRRGAGIVTRDWSYPQAATVTTFGHQLQHQGLSTEFHRQHGPLTTVPMQGLSSSLVWVDSPDEAARLAGLDDAGFRQELEARLQGLLGSVTELGPRGSFALTGMAAETLGRGRVALIGEAGHVMPPIGAQGLNLGLRDAAALAEALSEARGDASWCRAVSRYAARRAPDVTARMTAIDALNRSLLSDFLPAHLARGFGLFALTALGPLRRYVVREGLQPSRAIPVLMQPRGRDLLATATPSITGQVSSAT